MSSKVCRVVVIVMLLCVVAFVATVLTQTRAEQGVAAAVTEEAKKPILEKPTLEQRMDALEKNQNQILAELKQIRQTQDEILQMTQKIFTYMKRK